MAKPNKEKNVRSPALRERSDIAALVGTVIGSVLEASVGVTTPPVAVPWVVVLLVSR
jgi:hypothetical protein